MSQLVFIDRQTRCWARQGGESRADQADDVWPEVSSRYALDNTAPVNPQNTPRRVLFEVGLVLAIAAIMAVAAAFMFPIMP
jgi:hypothetical protein